MVAGRLARTDALVDRRLGDRAPEPLVPRFLVVTCTPEQVNVEFAYAMLPLPQWKYAPPTWSEKFGRTNFLCSESASR